MINRTIALLRHAEDDIHNRCYLDETNKGLARKKGEELLQGMGIANNVASIILASSIAPRAVQTLEAIREGLGLPKEHPIYSSDKLIDSGDVYSAFTFIDALPKTPFLVVITHRDAFYSLARRLGAKNEIPKKPGYLEGIIFPEGTWGK